MLHFALQYSLFLFAFWAVYMLFLKRETFFTANRIYLLLTPILAAIIPFLQVSFLGAYAEQAQQIVQMPAIVLGEINASETTAQSIAMVEQLSPSFWEQHALGLIYLIGVFVSAIRFTYKLMRFQKLKKSGTASQLGTLKLITVPQSQVACTFFKTIYLGSALQASEKAQIIKHEQVHAEHYHSVDLLFFEVLKIACWFNPVVYLYQRQLTHLHEYIADAKATEGSSKKQYYESLLNLAFGSQRISFINQFFNHSLIKKRIVMLQKSKSAKRAKLKYLVLIPVLLLMLTYVSCSNNSDLHQQEENKEVEMPPLPPTPPTPPSPSSVPEPPEPPSEGDTTIITTKDVQRMSASEKADFIDTFSEAYAVSVENNSDTLIVIKETGELVTDFPYFMK